jgi:hypothetical protein
MIDLEERLQAYIQKLESGTPLDEVLESLPDCDREMRHMLFMVSSMRAFPKPSDTPLNAAVQDRTVIDFIDHYSEKPAKPAFDWFPRLWGIPIHPPMKIGLALVLFSLLLVVFLFTRPSKVMLVAAQVSGQVDVSTSLLAEDWRSLMPGDAIIAGQRIRTGTNSTAALNFYGSVIELAPKTEILLNAASMDYKKNLSLELTQYTGITWHDLIPEHAFQGAYILHTPAGEARVRGADFMVAVLSDGQSFFAVEEGELSVTTGQKTIILPAGYATRTVMGQFDIPLAFSFYSYGKYIQSDERHWQIDNLSILLEEDALVPPEVTTGDFLLVMGRILTDGSWLAEAILPVESTAHAVRFSGQLKAIGKDLWLVDDVSLLVNSDTLYPDELVLGNPVRVTYTNLDDGRRLALRIDALSQMSMVARPSLFFDFDEVEISSCQSHINISDKIINTSSHPYDAASNVEFQLEVLTGKEFIERISIHPERIAEIKAGGAIPFAIDLLMADTWLIPGNRYPIQLVLSIAPNPEFSGYHIPTMIIRIEQDCAEEQKTPQPMVVTRASSSGKVCPERAPSGEQLRLSDYYDVTIYEINQWYCIGFNLGEIDLAYNISLQADVPISYVFSLRRSGMSWGDIMNELGIAPDKAPRPNHAMPSQTPKPGENPAPVATATKHAPGVPAKTMTPPTPPSPPTPPTPPVPSMTPPTPPGPED